MAGESDLAMRAGVYADVAALQPRKCFLHSALECRPMPISLSISIARQSLGKKVFEPKNRESLGPCPDRTSYGKTGDFPMVNHELVLESRL